MIGQRFRRLGVIPVITLTNASEANPVGEALVRGGLPCAEVTLRTDAALEGIQALARRDDLLIGAGTILSIDQAAEARKAGAEFLVSPGFNPRVVGWALENDIPIFPGVSSATEIEQALDFGLLQVKFFPAEPLGGVNLIKALTKPYHMMEFIPTGGISLKNLHQYLAIPQVLACGGSWMVKSEWLQKGDFEKVIIETENTVQQIKKTQDIG